jgi:hypothetical protein
VPWRGRPNASAPSAGPRVGRRAWLLSERLASLAWPEALGWTAGTIRIRERRRSPAGGGAVDEARHARYAHAERNGMTPVKTAGKVTIPSEDEFLSDDQVIDACVRAWLGPVALLTIGLRVVVASVQADQGPRSPKARVVGTTLRIPQLGSAPKRPAASKPVNRNGGRLPPGKQKDGTRGRARRGRSEGGFRSAIAKFAARARWFS